MLRPPGVAVAVAVCVFVALSVAVVVLRPQPIDSEVLTGGAVRVPENVYLGAYNSPDAAGKVSVPQNAPARDALGRELAIDGHYHEFLGVFPSEGERADAKLGQIPMISWQPTGIKLADISAGRYDNVIRHRADDLKKFARPVFLRFAHEMNGDWTSWSPAAPEGKALGNSVEDFVAAWRHLHQLFAEEGATNVAWVWCPNAVDYPSGNTAMQYYPGDDYVDWVGVDAYNFGVGPGSKWLTFSNLLDPIYKKLPNNKPVVLAEFGSAEVGGSKAVWTDDMAARLQQDYRRVRAVVFFDKTYEQADFRINSSPPALAAARKMANEPYFSAMPPE